MGKAGKTLMLCRMGGLTGWVNTRDLHGGGSVEGKKVMAAKGIKKY